MYSYPFVPLPLYGFQCIEESTPWSFIWTRKTRVPGTDNFGDTCDGMRMGSVSPKTRLVGSFVRAESNGYERIPV